MNLTKNVPECETTSHQDVVPTVHKQIHTEEKTDQMPQSVPNGTIFHLNILHNTLLYYHLSVICVSK